MSFLQGNKFQFSLSKVPSLNATVNKVRMPGISVQSTKVNTPFSAIPLPGTTPIFDPLTIWFKLESDMDAYLDLFLWLQGIAFPEGYSQRKEYIGEKKPLVHELYGDCTLTLLDNNSNPNKKLTYVDVTPVNVSGFEFDSSVNTVQYVDISLTMEYSYFTIS